MAGKLLLEDGEKTFKDVVYKPMACTTTTASQQEQADGLHYYNGFAAGTSRWFALPQLEDGGNAG